MEMQEDWMLAESGKPWAVVLAFSGPFVVASLGAEVTEVELGGRVIPAFSSLC